MRVQIVDPGANTPPYDRALCAALTEAGAEVELSTTRFVHGDVAGAVGYAEDDSWYRLAARLPAGSVARRLAAAAGHLPSIARQRHRAASFDLVHHQWMTFPGLDGRLSRRDRPQVWTTHGFLRSADERGPASPTIRAALARMDAVVALSEYGAARLRDEAGVPAERIHVIPHGALDYLTKVPSERPLPAELEGAAGPVVLSFGLIRPYKGVDVLLEAFRDPALAGAELWVVGRPLGVDPGELRAAAAAVPGRVRFVDRYVADDEVGAIFRRADLVALPYRDVEQSGVLYTAIAFGKAIVASAVGGFPEVAERDGALLPVPPGDAGALAAAIAGLLSDPERRRALAAASAAAAAGRFSWEAVASQHLNLYRSLLARPR